MAYHRHVFAQGKGLGALLAFVTQGPGKGLTTLPGPIVEEKVNAPNKALADDFVRFCGGDPSQHGDLVSPLLFSQWTLPVMLKAAANLPYPPVKVVNAGFRLEIDGPVPVNSRLHLSAQVLAVEETERGANVRIGVDTSNTDGSRLLHAEIRVVIPQRKRDDKARPHGERKEKPRVPANARLLVERRLPKNAGLSFAELTGDFNPIHWVAPYARAMRFRNVILHGFGTAAIAFEAVGRQLLSGRFARIRAIDLDFTRPLVLPAKVGVFVEPTDGGVSLSVGDAPSGPAYSHGRVELLD
jgi:acyl dehydratase